MLWEGPKIAANRIHSNTEAQISFAELAVNYEVATGTQLPRKVNGKYLLADKHDTAKVVRQTLQEKAMIIQNVLKTLYKDTGEPGYLGSREQVNTLRHMGCNKAVYGLTSRPLMKAETNTKTTLE